VHSNKLTHNLRFGACCWCTQTNQRTTYDLVLALRNGWFAGRSKRESSKSRRSGKSNRGKFVTTLLLVESYVFVGATPQDSVCFLLLVMLYSLIFHLFTTRFLPIFCFHKFRMLILFGQAFANLMLPRLSAPFLNVGQNRTPGAVVGPTMPACHAAEHQGDQGR
jgi:hypothetical protein